MAVSGVNNTSATNQYTSSAKSTSESTEKKLGKYLTDEAVKRLDEIANDVDNNKKISDNKMNSKDAFMKILMTQLQNQDPLSPMQNSDMIAQMSQFSQLEAIQQLAVTNESSLNSLSYLVEKADNNEMMQLEIVNQLVKLNKAIEEYVGVTDTEDDTETDTDTEGDGDTDESTEAPTES